MLLRDFSFYLNQKYPVYPILFIFKTKLYYMAFLEFWQLCFLFVKL